ncbi:FYVE zinc finger-domain-containing protein [Hygrophoropsis aurantiaca]|uniref:FYVE zinc finger-domain-containing protein n=1 Tax=Hygrophoropsis aurantiaca TaxID=72124 RepID=A0ACB8AET7_9AGAM|nr:FYVE zinc finger-domain-containing protein [Hygrophoropsis aurantiaca]
MSVLATTLADWAAKAQFTMSRCSSPLDAASECSSEASGSTSCNSSPSEPALSVALPPRANEHLAVLLPKNLWKPDSLASTCDNFYCHVKFSVLERRHHCRKCGGVFCHQCTSRSSPLLDVSNLDFLHPPRNVPISTFDSPSSPVTTEKVCDDCWDHIHGCNPIRTPDLTPSTPLLVKSPMTSRSASPISSTCTSPMEQSAVPNRVIRVVRSSSQLSARNTTFPSALMATTADLDISEPSYGELDAYPLRRCSIICKATGGGRWEPKHSPPKVGLRIPGYKAPFEMELEREEQEERRRQLNPIVRDGDFQYRFPQDRVPTSLARTPCRFSTF